MSGLFFTLRRIYEHRSPLLITFVEFEKAFDSIDREGCGKLLQHTGFQANIFE